MTHDELIERAAKWLSRKHPIVITELSTYAFEIPDAIGFTTNGFTTLVECKASRQDFLADARKFFRRDPDRGLGDFRYYFTPKNLLSVDEIPDKWGLLEVRGKRIYMIKKALRQENKNYRSELCLLVSCIRRLGKDIEKGVNVKVYDIPDKKTITKATLGIRE